MEDQNPTPIIWTLPLPAAVVVPPPAAVVVPPPPDDDDGGAARRRRLRRFVPGPRDPVAVLLAFPRGADDFPRLPPGGERGAAPVIVIIPAGGGAEPPLAATRAAFLAAARRREGVNYPVYVLETPGPTAAPAPTLLEAVQARLRVAVPGAAPPQAAGWPAGQGARLLRLAVVGTGPAAQVVTTVVDLA